MITDDFTNSDHHSKHHHLSSILANQSPSPATSTTTTTINHQQPSQHRISNHSPDTSPSHLLLLGWIWSGRSTTATVWTSPYTLTFDPARLRPCQASSLLSQAESRSDLTRSALASLRLLGQSPCLCRRSSWI
ncbi:hypothetical protein M6B38_197125 [Iris pallida]|uniref:Uncharacterized protein n=1 Tax=Iris pallida TaxID=29817 RepID=A0AAX6EC07_IRIPA|nr:hypothetical protein M6B38_197125 [Iris pallida]